jgi:hypothetical protein
MNTQQFTVSPGSWRKSSYCDTGGQCIEVAPAGTSRLVRDSKNPDGSCLALSARAWTAFIRGIRDGTHGA